MRLVPAILLSTIALHAQWRVMPMPSSIESRPGALRVGPDFSIAIDGYTEPRLDRAVGRLRERIRQVTTFEPRAVKGAATLTIRVQAASRPVQSLDEDESYRLTVDGAHAEISAPNPLGAMHGLETFYQLLDNSADGWTVPGAAIDDRPRFNWRGFHLDVGRHFMPLDVVLRNLDGMAAVKLNVFHWHLSEDQGFRVESLRYPKLQELGSDGQYYTQQQIREVIGYARDRGIRVVPEFDIPGHATSWLAGYPELAAAPGPFQIIRTWGVHDPAMDPANPKVYEFLDSFIGEMAALFPDAYFHIGGDEVNGKEWGANQTDIPPFMQSHGFKTQHDLQAYFNQQVEKIVTKYGKCMEGWDEILNPALPKDIVIQSWRGPKSLADAARQGYQGILSSGYYLDHIEPSSKLYLVDPMGDQAAALTPEERKHILGGEVCMWTEYVAAQNVDTRIWPRTAAIAERFWSPASVKNVADMYRRLDIADAELDRIGLTQNSVYRLMLENLAGSSNIEAVKTLADVADPGALGLRHHVNPNYAQDTPLNRFVDTARPDSPVARHFNELADRYLANRNDSAARDEIRRWLGLWAANDAKLQPLIAHRQILSDAGPVSTALARISRLALSGGKATDPALAAAQKPIGEVHLAVAPAIAKLVKAGLR
ncbi:MAG: family 20 glycosylhydrolase [Acidobacteriota bacterium]|nr:family 20 glycosylhydrolase [Acidobacteriota bacterium]